MVAKTAKKRILHVDDNDDTLKIVKIILENEGFDVISVSKGKDALKKIDMNNFSLIILDVMMPDMSGWDLFTRIAKIKPNYKIIFLSILDISEEKIKKLKNNGIKDYIKKPFDNNNFVARIKKVINA